MISYYVWWNGVSGRGANWSVMKVGAIPVGAWFITNFGGTYAMCMAHVADLRRNNR
jgi:hypothetical protein